VPDAAASNIHDFPWRDICVSSTQFKNLFRTKLTYLNLENPKKPEVFLSKILNSHRETMF
jgi:hypothetical protein